MPNSIGDLNLPLLVLELIERNLLAFAIASAASASLGLCSGASETPMRARGRFSYTTPGR